MSYGITPYDFVQQVFYMQEKVILDFHPTDDKYKEVLMEANLVLQELQKEEDWLWLREHRTLGFAATPPIFRNGGHTHFGRHQHDIEIELPSDVYKPSMLYGDCMRLCKWRIRHREMEEFLLSALSYKEYWDGLDSVTPDDVLTFYGDTAVIDVDMSGYEYGGSFPFRLADVSPRDMPRIIGRGRWYVDRDGVLLVGDNASKAGSEYSYFSEEDPFLVYVKHPPEIEMKTRDDVVKDIDPSCFDPSPHNLYEIFHLHCEHWHFMPMGLKVIWNDLSDPFEFIEVFENDFIRVPFMSGGSQYRTNFSQTGRFMDVNRPSPELGASMIGNRLTFTRPLLPHEADRVVVIDVQKRIEQFHICDDRCVSVITESSGKRSDVFWPGNPCAEATRQADRLMLKDIPDINYVITRTAALHAEGSPSAQGRIMGLQDQAQKLLSAMRQNNADATSPDYIDWNPFHVVTAI